MDIVWLITANAVVWFCINLLASIYQLLVGLNMCTIIKTWLSCARQKSTHLILKFILCFACGRKQSQALILMLTTLEKEQEKMIYVQTR